jgi:hypothetical protein
MTSPPPPDERTDGVDRPAAVQRLRVRIVEGPDPDHPLELRGEQGVVLNDLNGRGGPSLGDLRVAETVVPLGTQIRIGRTVLALLDATGVEDVAQAGPPAPETAVVPRYRVARAEALAIFERHYLRRLIAATGGNASAAARAANMDRPYLLSLLRRHGLR